MQLSGNTVLITGGATAISYAMAEPSWTPEVRSPSAAARKRVFSRRARNIPVFTHGSATYLMKRIADGYWNGRRPSFPV